MSKDTPKPAAFGPWVAKVLAVPNLQEAREQLVYAHIALSHARGNGDCPRESVDKAHIAIEMALAAIRAYEPVETTLAAPSFPAQPATELRRLHAESERDEALLRQAEPATAQDEREVRAWPDVAGIGRDSEHPRAVVLYLRHEPSDEHLRTIQEALRTRPAQPAINGYTCTVPDDCETLHWRGQILSMNELASMAQPAVGEGDEQ